MSGFLIYGILNCAANASLTRTYLLLSYALPNTCLYNQPDVNDVQAALLACSYVNSCVNQVFF